MDVWWKMSPKYLKNDLQNRTCGHTFALVEFLRAPLGHPFSDFSANRFLDTFWLPFGSLLAPRLTPFGVLLAPVGLLLAPFVFPFAPF